MHIPLSTHYVLFIAILLVIINLVTSIQPNDLHQAPYPPGGIAPTLPITDLAHPGGGDGGDDSDGDPTTLDLTSPPLPTKQHQYGLLIDAGSTGSRIHITYWHPRVQRISTASQFTISQPPFSRPREQSMASFKVSPGIHTIFTNPTLSLASSTVLPSPDASDITHDEDGVNDDLSPSSTTHYAMVKASLSPLIQFAYDYFKTMGIDHHIPYFPIYFCATGGVRSLQDDQRDALVTHVRHYLYTTGFYFEPQFADIISGEMEGLFAWLAVNYRLSDYKLFSTMVEPAIYQTPSSAPSSLSPSSSLGEEQSQGTDAVHGQANKVSIEPDTTAASPATTHNTFLTSLISQFRGGSGGTPTTPYEPVATLDMGGATIQLAFMQNATSLLSSIPLTIGSVHRNMYVQCFWFYGKDSSLWRVHNLLYSLEFNARASSPPGKSNDGPSQQSQLHMPPPTINKDDIVTPLLHNHDDQHTSSYLHKYSTFIRSWVKTHLGIDRQHAHQPHNGDDDVDGDGNTHDNNGGLDEAITHDTPRGENDNNDSTPPTTLPTLLASPCLPIGYETTFTAFNGDTVVLIGNANYSACYEIARHLVITRTTSPCLNTGTHYKTNLEHFHEFIDDTTSPFFNHRDAIKTIKDHKLRKELKQQSKAQQEQLKLFLRSQPDRDGDVSHISESMMASTGQCTSFYGKYQPDFEQRKLYAFSGVSYFPQFMQLTNPAEFASQLDLSQIQQKGQEFCQIPWTTLVAQYPDEDPSVLRLYCWLSLYSIAVLHDGLQLPMTNTPLYVINQSGGQKMTYAPGAMLYYANQLPFTIQPRSPTHSASTTGDVTPPVSGSTVSDEHPPLGKHPSTYLSILQSPLRLIILMLGSILVFILGAFIVYPLLRVPSKTFGRRRPIRIGDSDEENLLSESSPLLSS